MENTESVKKVEKRKLKIDRDLVDISLTSNVRASFGYLDKKGTAIELENHGDSEYITFGELRTMASGRHKKTLHNMYVLITDVEDPEGEVEVEDVLQQLRLTKYYDTAKKIFGVDHLDETSFDDFVKNAKLEDIIKALEHDFLVNGLTESAVHLHRQGKIGLEKTKEIFNACGIKTSRFYDFLSDLS